MKNTIKQSLITVLLACAMLVVVVPVGYVCLNHDVAAIAEFEDLAEQELGTSDFTVTSIDGFLQAVTTDGDKYPDDDQLEQYFSDKIYSHLGVYATVLLVAFIVSIAVGFYQYKKCQLDSSGETVRQSEE